MANAVLVTNMVAGFLEAGHILYCGDEAREIIPNAQRLIEAEQAAGGSVIFVCDTHDPDDLEFQMFPVHCVRGTAEAEVIPELRGYEGTRLPKHRYSAFFDTELASLLEELRPARGLAGAVWALARPAAAARARDMRDASAIRASAAMGLGDLRSEDGFRRAESRRRSEEAAAALPRVDEGWAGVISLEHIIGGGYFECWG